MTKITGRAAIDFSERNGLLLSKYADPINGARDGVTVADARAIADADPALIYLDVSHMRVEAGSGEDHDVGAIVALQDDETALVSWESGVRTPCPIHILSYVA